MFCEKLYREQELLCYSTIIDQVLLASTISEYSSLWVEVWFCYVYLIY